MTQFDFDKEFEQRFALVNACEAATISDWQASVDVPFVAACHRVADLYWNASTTQQLKVRRAFRRYVSGKDDYWSLQLYIRLCAQRIRNDGDVKWVQRGLAMASIIGPNCDFRDMIVSLVMLRYCAESRAVETGSIFDEALSKATVGMTGILSNARDHSESNVSSTIEHFGPPEWQEEVD